MKIYHRLNQFLLERFPSIWNTQFVWVMLIGLLLHLLFFLAGYISLDLDVLKSYSVRTHFFSSSVFSIYIVLCLVVFIFTAFRYFSHNPFRNYYPLGRVYFWKVYLMLCIEIFFFLAIFMSYETGMTLKARRLVSDREIYRDIQKINTAYPFFFSDISEYNITKRSWPKPFPLDDLRNFTIGYDSINNTEIKHLINKKETYITLNGTDYQFGVLGSKVIDSCRNESIIEHYTDIHSVYGLQEYSLYNFSSLFINNFKRQTYNYADYAPRVHQLFLSRSIDSIQHCFSEVNDVAKRYRLSYFLRPEKMAETILRQNPDDKVLMRVSMTDAIYGTEAAEGTSNDSRKNIAFNYTIDLNRFKNLANNKEELDDRMGFNQLKSEILWVIIFMSMFAAFVLIIFKYVVLKEILIGTVVAGMMISIASLITYLLLQKNAHYDSGYYPQQEKQMTLTISLMCLVVIVNGVYRILSSTAKKKWALIFFVSTLGALLIFIPATYNFIRIATMKAFSSPCQNDITWTNRFTPYPWHFFILYIPLLGLVFYLLRRLHAKPE